MDIVTRIKQNHTDLRAALRKLADTTDNAVKSRSYLFDNLYREITAHMDGEEVSLYPALQNTELKQQGEQAAAEHGEIREKIVRFNELPVKGQAWKDELITLRKIIEDHFDMEERDILPRLHDLFDSSTYDQISMKFARRREEVIQTLA